jgi:hypothetical protein
LDPTAFKQSLTGDGPPVGLTLAQEALWHAAKGDWNTAHERAQAQEDRAGSWVHAYLHRLEGDAGNAAYWYRRAGRPVATESLEEEWEGLVRALFPRPQS